MKILLASIPVPGHLNPLLELGRILSKNNHDVVVQTGKGLRPVVEAAGLPFIPLLPEADIHPSRYFERYPERQKKTPGIEMIAFDVEHYFISALAPQAAGLKIALQDFAADVVLAESLFWGTIPLLLGPREERPAIAHLGVSVLNVGGGKNIPPRPDVSPEELHAEKSERERVLLQPVQKAMNRALANIDCDPLPCPLLEAVSTLPDLYLHPGIRSFQYSRGSSSSRVRYIGPLPLPPGQYSLPDWWSELDGTKRLVLLTQGTVANRDFGQLIGPALKGLAEEKDVVVLVTTGGQPVESIPIEIPANARVVQFLPYDLVLPRVDLLITNGGYGTVNMALANGVPIVSAGLTEDKEEVSAHVQWSGAGIDLRTNQASPDAVRAAARNILDTSAYRDRARELAFEFKCHDSEAEALELIESCVLATTKA
jgi:UDP:flavonoid glycosyltransferase YjiC (YdhE family)